MVDLLRLRFCKTGKAKYISHLDLMATIRRALLRTGIRLKYSQGYNPHPYISVALPLPIGCGSACELADFGTTGGLLPDGLQEMIAGALPEGLEILEVYIPKRKFSEIAWIELNGALHYDKGTPQKAAEMLAERFSAKSIVISKKTKRGISDLDIAPHIKDIEFRHNGESSELSMTVKASAQNPTIKPDDLISALEGEFSALKPDFSLFARKEIYDKNMKVFR